jgi:hypothetical protein
MITLISKKENFKFIRNLVHYSFSTKTIAILQSIFNATEMLSGVGLISSRGGPGGYSGGQISGGGGS